jgi:hypothetical protein
MIGGYIDQFIFILMKQIVKQNGIFNGNFVNKFNLQNIKKINIIHGIEMDVKIHMMKVIQRIKIYLEKLENYLWFVNYLILQITKEVS